MQIACYTHKTPKRSCTMQSHSIPPSYIPQRKVKIARDHNSNCIHAITHNFFSIFFFLYFFFYVSCMVRKKSVSNLQWFWNNRERKLRKNGIFRSAGGIIQRITPIDVRNLKLRVCATRINRTAWDSRNFCANLIRKDTINTAAWMEEEILIWVKKTFGWDSTGKWKFFCA